MDLKDAGTAGRVLRAHAPLHLAMVVHDQAHVNLTKIGHRHHRIAIRFHWSEASPLNSLSQLH